MYIPAQMLGAMVGQTLVWLFYMPHWAVTEDADAKLACFCTAPAIRRPVWNVVAEFIGTFMLFFVASAITSKAVVGDHGLAVGLSPYLVGMLVWGIGMSLGGGYRVCDQPGARSGAENHARDAACRGQARFGLGLCMGADRGGRLRERRLRR